ncbi:MAG: hypothetical protein ACPGU1_09460 [Myxococcota bacterium]
MRVIKNITISLGVLALIAAAPACGDSDGTADNGDNTATDAGAEPGGDEPAGDDAGSTEPGDDATTTEGGDDATTTEGGDDATTTEGGDDAATTEGGDDAATTEGGDDAATTEGGEGACTNADDQAVIDDPDTDVTAVATEYAYQCLTSDDIGSCTAEGVTNDTGLSTDCALCYAEQVVCAAENCLGECISDSEAQACVDCRNENCVPLFEPCSGIPASTDE